MATGDDGVDRFRVPRWISDGDSEDDELAERPPTTEDWSQPHGGERYVPRAQTPPLNAGEPLWPATPALPPPVTRGQREAAEPQRRGLIILAVAAAVVVIVAAGLLIRGVGGDNRGAGDNPGAGDNRGASDNRAAGGGDKKATAAAPAQPTASATQGEPPTTQPTTGGQDNTFGPLTIEAESPGNTLTGSARVVDYPNASGGRVVRNIGDWRLDPGPGTLRFNNIDVPRSGNYTLAFSYVDIDNEANRTAVIDISGRSGLVVTVNGNDSCCRTQTVQVPLRRGKNTIAFSNLTSHAPSIDKIVITAP
jgi:hypothetical protein